MSETIPAAAPEPVAVAPAPIPTPPAPAPAPVADTAAPTPPWGDTENFNAEKAWNLIQGLRDDKKNAARAVEEAKQSIVQQIGKAIGLVEDEPVDAATLTQQLTASQQDAKRAALELAIYRAAPAEVDPNDLLDRRSFMATVENLDPSNTDGIRQAIAAAITANPSLVRNQGEPQARGLQPNPAQGASAAPTPSVFDMIAAAEAAHNPREAIRLKSALALNQQ